MHWMASCQDDLVCGAKKQSCAAELQQMSGLDKCMHIRHVQTKLAFSTCLGSAMAALGITGSYVTMLASKARHVFHPDLRNRT